MLSTDELVEWAAKWAAFGAEVHSAKSDDGKIDRDERVKLGKKAIRMAARFAIDVID